MSSTPEEQLAEKRANLERFLQEHATQLMGIIRSYVVRLGPASAESVSNLTAEVFQDAVVEALRCAERLDMTMQPRAWFLGIATNMLKRKRAGAARLYRFEVLASDLPRRLASASESELFDQLSPRFAPGPEQDLEIREQVRDLLTLVSASDAEILCLALLYDLDSEALAGRLGVSVGAARVRLHRAQKRLRTAWTRRAALEKRGDRHA